VEPRANHLLVGAFVLTALIAAFVVTIWLARIQSGDAQVHYRIYFRGSVEGLGRGADVRYRGIRVGSIRDITIDPDDPSRVSVRVAIDADTPIRQGDQAVLQYQALTGIASINIGGAIIGSPLLEPEPGEDLAVIPSATSPFEQLVEGAPELVQRGILLMDRVSALLRPENQERVSEILANVEVLTGELADQRERIMSILESLEAGSRDLAVTAGNVRSLSEDAGALLARADSAAQVAGRALGNIDRIVTRDLARLMTDLGGAASSLEDMAREARLLVAENREPVNAFTNDGLAEFSRLVAEARLLVAGMSRLSDRVERDGARFLFGRPDSEFRPR
jgi:phospholipid/cholesterol/gamma-HCH transport system substrate-binding protein